MQKSFVRRAAAGIAATAAAVTATIAPYAAHAGSAIGNLAESANATAQAAGVKPIGNEGRTLPELVGSFISAALGLLGVVLVVLIIYAGFLWMTAQGSEDKVKTAKKIISSAVIGMIIIFAAYAITDFVVESLATSITPSA